ncbi:MULTISPECIES: AfsR/SARP family transcriptional regulator [unclassified Streptomyces]|uniref:AfsR/SARP family transcriptional regulator n=1 Tax=unclassified Streptomyces TaxID=2593676 RepID=UPI002034001E|nr:AfsR/SARP family transcriptional regulator [Streptomyces sp. RKAG290]MCM2410721.1 AfsR/SARP family transcriptional regulator [Streptomyces sp. RKAG290]
MRYEILGTLRIRAARTDVAVNARNMEVALAALLIRAGEVVSTAQLANEIWGERPPRRYLAAIHVYISQLRKLLTAGGPGPSPIVTRSPGYLIGLGDEGRLDVDEFQRLIRRGRVLAREDRHQEALDIFETALGLWRGPALGDLRAGPIVDTFVTWAEEARLECAELRIDSALSLGRHRELIGPLHTLVGSHPLHEAFHRQLMMALYRSERQAEALHVYRSARRTINEELGIEPCRSLRDLHRAILQADRRLDVPSAA